MIAKKPYRPQRRLFASWSIRARVFMGFGAALMLLVSIALLGTYSMGQVQRAFVDYEISAKTTFDINDLNLTLGEMRLSLETYYGNPTEQTATHAQAAADALLARSTAIQQSVAFDPVASNLAAPIAELAVSIKAGLTQSAAQQSALDDVLIVFFEHAQTIQKSLVGITDLAFSGQDYEGTFYAAMALQQFAQSRSNIEQFLLTGDTSLFQLASTNAANARTSFRNSMALRFDESYESRRTAFNDGLKAYRERMPELGAAFEARTLQRAALRDQLGAQVQGLVSTLTQHVNAQQTAFGRHSAQHTDQTRTDLMTFTIGALIAGLVFAVLTEWSISNSINWFSASMRRMAQDDLDIAFRSMDSEHPLGQMTKALKVLRDNAVEAKASEAEKRQMLEQQSKDALAAQEQANAAHVQKIEAEASERARQDKAQQELRRAEMERQEERRAQLAEQMLVVDALANGLRRLSVGDVRETIETPFPDDQEPLRADYNEAVASLRSLIAQITTVSQTLLANAGEISDAATHLSSRTEQTSATLSDSATAISTISQNVQSTAENAGLAEERVKGVTATAQSANQIVHEAIETMGAITASSQKVSRIVHVIEDIAFQTNLLSLNASVEAARAGDAGLGFAVVATEVRGLSQRSSDAAREINALIATAGHDVERGVDFVNQTGQVLQSIFDDVASVEGIMSDIATSAGHQAQGLKGIDTSVSDLDQTTQSNAAIAEQVTASSEMLTQEAHMLSDLVSKFTIDADMTQAEMQWAQKRAKSADASATPS